MSAALIVFGKQPVIGDVKTRLATRITPEEAAHLYKAFVEDALEQYAQLPMDVRLYLAGGAAHLTDGTADVNVQTGNESVQTGNVRAQNVGVPGDANSGAAGRLPLDVPAGVFVFAQRGDDLGARMLRAFAETFASGYHRVVIVGTDHPTLPSTIIQDSFNALDDADSVVIGPAEDGGYYLLGMSQPRPELFQDMNYSQDDVFDETLRRIRAATARPTVLRPWYDVDRPQDLPKLLRDLEPSGDVAPRTHGVLRDLAKKYRWL